MNILQIRQPTWDGFDDFEGYEDQTE